MRCTRRLIVATLMNLIDNAIYWSDVAAVPRESGEIRKKRLYIGPSNDDPRGPAIVVADNGFGFRDEPAALVQALVSRRPEGMGIGLHLADQVMRAHGVFLPSRKPGMSQFRRGTEAQWLHLSSGTPPIDAFGRTYERPCDCASLGRG